MNPVTSKFLTLFNQVEKHLEALVGEKERTTFYTLIEKGARKSLAVQRLKGKLKEFGDIRNLLVHGYDVDRETVIPTDGLLARLDQVRNAIVAPPLLISLVSGNVETCGLDDPVGAAARKLNAHSFSQLPICEGDTIVGLLTAETLSRWLAACLESNGGLLEEEPVAKVLCHQEKRRNHILMGRNASVFEALEEFDEAFHAGEALDAIIVTDNGKVTESPLGIATVSDMPKLVRAAATL